MEYNTIYEYIIEKSFGVLNLVPPFLVLVLSIMFLIHFKKHNKSFTIRRQMIIFLGYLFATISLLITISILYNIPKIISSEKQINDIIKNKSYIVVEGEIEHYKLEEANGQYFESFSICNVNFEYSDFIEIKGFHQTSKNNGPINENGQYFRIYYVNLNGGNVILKIEEGIKK